VIFDWQAIDHSLVGLKLTDLSIEMNSRMEAEERRIYFENRLNMNSNTIPRLLLEMKEDVADERARRAYEIYCDVWKTQGNAKTAAFVRAVFARAIRVMLQARANAIASEFSRRANATSFPGNITNAHLTALKLRMQRLQDRWFRRIEAEAKGLEHCERMEQLRLNTPISERSPTVVGTNAPPPNESANRESSENPRLEVIISKVRNPQKYTFLTVDEAKDYFGITSKTIYRWIADGKLKPGARRGTVTIKSIQQWEIRRMRKRG
jgi:excisionase family DNA binding protein